MEATEHRADYRVSIDMLLNKYVNGRPHVVRATDISRTGLRVHRLFEPSMDQQSVGLQFQLPDSDRVITCAGRVIHLEDERAQGIEFTNVAEEHQQLIDDYIASSVT